MTNVLSRSTPPERDDYDPIIEGYQASAQDITLVSIGNILLRHRWLLASLAVVGFVIFGFNAYRPFNTYTANTLFAPRSRVQQSISSSVLSQLGIATGTSGAGGAYYMEVIKSPRILGPVVQSTYSFKTDSGVVRGSLIDIYGLKGLPPRNAKALAVSMLTTQIKTVSPPGGIMKLSVTSPYAALSAQLAQRILEELNRFNLETRREQASGERQFIEMRVAEARMQLTSAENALQRFTTVNQGYQAISPLALEAERLRREVDLRQGLYEQLAKALDQARIDEVRDNPFLTIIEPAEIPLGPDASVWQRKALLGAIIGLFLGILIAFLHSYVARTRDSYSDDYAELARLKRETANDFRRPWRPIVRILATGRP